MEAPTSTLAPDEKNDQVLFKKQVEVNPAASYQTTPAIAYGDNVTQATAPDYYSYRPSQWYDTQPSAEPDKRTSAGYYGNRPPPPPPPPPPGFYYSEPPPGYAQVIIIQRRTFDAKEVRLRFIRKVYTILFLQLLFTTGLIALFILEPHVKRFVWMNRWLVYISLIIYIIVYFMLVCVEPLRRKSPINIIMLMIFTTALGFMAALISTFYELEVVLISFGITTLVCLMVTIFAMQTKFDFTMCGVCLMVGILLLCIFGIVLLFFRNEILQFIYASLATLLFSMFLAYDTQTIMGGKFIELSPNEYVLGAIQLYLDIVMIFLSILQLCGLVRN